MIHIWSFRSGGNSEFILEALSNIRVLNSICVSLFPLWRESLHTIILSNYHQKYSIYLFIDFFSDISLLTLIFSYAVTQDFCWGHYCSRKRPVKCCMCIPLYGSRPFPVCFLSAFFTFAFISPHALCVPLQSHDFNVKPTNSFSPLHLKEVKKARQ